MSHQPRPGDGGLGGESPESVGVDTNSSTSSSSSVDCAEEQRSALADGFTRRPLIHPARLKVQKRRLSISSATAALSLAGNGWSLHGHMTEGTSGCMPNNRQPQNPFLNGGYGSNKRNSVPDLRLNNLFTSTQQEGSGERNNHFVNGRPQLVQSNRNARSTVSDIIASEHDDRNDIMLNFSGLRLPNTATSNHHVHQSPPTTVVNRQPPSVGLNHNVVKGNQSPPPGKRARCPVVTLIVFSLTTNIVLLFVLFMYVYKPSVLASSVSL